MGFKKILDLDEVPGMLGRADANIQNCEGMLNAIGFQLVENTLSRLHRSVSPAGVPFKPINSITAAAREGQKGGESPLQDEGTHIAPSLGHRVSGNKLVWGSEWEFMPIHQFGGVITPKGKFLAIPLNAEARREGLKRLRQRGLFRPRGTRVLALPSEGGEHPLFGKLGFTPMFYLATKVTIPKRELIGFSQEEDKPLVMDIVKDHASQAFAET